jgi:hypothetical protein
MKKLLLISFTIFAINLHSQNKIESALEESFSNGAWANTAGTNYQYDANNNLISEIRYSWFDNAWVPFYKTVYTYNAANKAVTETSGFWNSTAFENNYKTTYTYNPAGKLITLLDQDWTLGSWVNSYKSDVTYNENLIVSVLSVEWTGGQWVTESSGTATYNGTNLTQWLDQDWDGSQFDNSYRTVLTRNASNKITNEREDLWSDVMQWEENYNTNYVLAANGNRTSQITSYEGVLDYKQDNTYDAAAQMSSFGHPFKDKTGVDYTFQDFPYVNKILSSLFYTYDISTASYTLETRTTYNYQSQLVLDKTNFEFKKISLYPNPTNSVLNIQTLEQIKTVTITDISGRVSSFKALDTKTIDVSSLPNGIYFVAIQTDNGTVREKFIKN